MSRLINVLFAGIFLSLTQIVIAGIIHVPGDSSTIQGGMSGSVDGDTVLVDKGRYYENIFFPKKKIVLVSVWGADSTVIDANHSGSVVVFDEQVDSSSVIDGFSLVNGYLTGSGFGGGIRCKFYCSPTIKNCIIANNSVEWAGGGIGAQGYSSPSIYNCIIQDNIAQGFGGGVNFERYSSAKIYNSVIKDNIAYIGGGGFDVGWSSPAIVNNLIVNNRSLGVYGGGGIFLWDSNALILNNTLYNNQSEYHGGGIYCASDTGFHVSYIINSIISSSPDGEGLYADPNSIPFLLHNDVWNNADGNFYGCGEGVGDTTWGINFNQTPCDSFYNIIRDPFFVDTINYTLDCSSACIDAGDTSWPVPDNGGRRIDIGAYEYPYIVGDANLDGEVTLSDVVYLISCIFKGGSCPCPQGEGDVNCDSQISVSDIVYLINYLFKAGPPPCGVIWRVKE